MGMFDSVIHKCTCGREVEWQSKADECCLGRYSPGSVPIAIANDINGEIDKCACGKSYRIDGCALPQKVAMIVTEVSDPDKHLCKHGLEQHYGCN